MNPRLILCAVAVVLFSACAARAQSGSDDGCGNSPECPTAVLAGVGAAGVAIARRFKR